MDNVDAILTVVPLTEGENKLGSMKALERLIAHHHRTLAEARIIMAPLFGIYDLRLADAHLGANNVSSGLARDGRHEGARACAGTSINEQLPRFASSILSRRSRQSSPDY